MGQRKVWSNADETVEWDWRQDSSSAPALALGDYKAGFLEHINVLHYGTAIYPRQLRA